MDNIKMVIGADEFAHLVAPLVGMPVFLPWCGYGSAIFLELGKPQPITNPKQRRPDGEACISLEWDWRIESDLKIVCGSSNSNPEIDSTISSLLDSTVTKIRLEGIIPELLIDFSNGYRLRSMAMKDGNPEWGVRLPDKTYLMSENGRVYQTAYSTPSGSSDLTSGERWAMNHAEATALRWGRPVPAMKSGKSCRNCRYFIRVDGSYHFLDYGVCTSLDSPFDGRAINVNCGCRAFLPWDD